jgi:hypothetical protein
MVLTFSGQLHIFNLRGKSLEGPWENKNYFDLYMFNDPENKKPKLKVFNYKFWGNGCAIWTKVGDNETKGRLFVATEFFKTSDPWIEYNTKEVSKIYCMEVIPKEFSNNNTVQVLISPRGTYSIEKKEGELTSKTVKEISTIFVCSKNDCSDLEIIEGPFTRMKLSYSGHYIALFTKRGELIVVSS